MWLINTTTLDLKLCSNSEPTPPYGILSHRWNSENENEVSFQDMVPNIYSTETAKKPGFAKIDKVCELARNAEPKLDYVWVDTCCINKTSSAELSEAINSMFKWYQKAVVCYVFLADLAPESVSLKDCEWFRRGWTLQELIAPREVHFYDKYWSVYGTKSSLQWQVAQITGIDQKILTGVTDLAEIPVAVRMSWAANRITSREEDMAYCLLGIFNVNMPMIYGEGSKAFTRLQEEIIKDNPDMSIFAWTASDNDEAEYVGLLAQSTKQFYSKDSLRLEHTSVFDTYEFSITNKGIRFNIALHLDEKSGYHILPLNHTHGKDRSALGPLGIYLRQVGPNYFVHALPRKLAITKEGETLRNVWVAKTLLSVQSESINRQVLHIHAPLDLTSGILTEVEPVGSWDPSKNVLYAGHTGSFIGFMHITPNWADEFDSFVLLCRFNSKSENGYPWQCNLVDGDRWRGIRSQYLKLYHLKSDSYRGSASQLKLELPHLYDENRARHVSITLCHKDTSGGMEYHLFLEIGKGGSNQISNAYEVKHILS